MDTRNSISSSIPDHCNSPGEYVLPAGDGVECGVVNLIGNSHVMHAAWTNRTQSRRTRSMGSNKGRG